MFPATALANALVSKGKRTEEFNRNRLVV